METVNKTVAGHRWLLISISSLFFLTSLHAIFRKSMRRQFSRLGSWFLDAFQRGFDERMGHRKLALFDGLHRMSTELGGTLNLVEIGVGNGGNFKYYPKGTKIACVEPNSDWAAYIAESAKRHASVEVTDVHATFAEKMTMIKDDSVDAVVSTLVMCGIQDVDKALSEIKRILRPGGKFFFLEHVAAKKGTWLYYAQCSANWFWVPLTDCNLMRPTHDIISKAGFSTVEYDYFYAEELVKPYPLWRILPIFIVKPHVTGVATK